MFPQRRLSLDHTQKFSLALCLLAAGLVSSSQAHSEPATDSSAEVAVPNIPAELSQAASEPAPASTTFETTSAPNCAASPPPQACIVAPAVHIGAPARRAIAESQEWAENPAAMPLRDTGGRVRFPFGESVPTIVCKPLAVCDIELQPGETVQGAPHIGDAIRWKVSPATSGSGENQVIHLIVKPTDVNLDTNLIIPTDHRTYHVRLVSSAQHYVASVAFDYPEEQLQESWQSFGGSYAKGDAAAGAGGMPTVAVNRLNFNYKIKVVKGKPTFKPLRAMDDGYHTYIAMNEDMPQREAPVLIGISPSGEEQMINYRLKKNLYVVDGTIFKLALISGVGRKQERIELTRDPCRERGWLGICWDPKE